jgi:hypothetical protein
MLKNLRVLATREKNETTGALAAVAICLDHFATGEGANDGDALEVLVYKLANEPFETLDPAPEKYQKLFSNSTRESKVVRGQFLLQVRSG